MKKENEMSDIELCSMDYWYPKIKDLGYPIPKTVKVDVSNISERDWYNALDGNATKEVIEVPNMIKKVVVDNNLKYPIFLRTDQYSGKHSWKDTCFIKNEEKLPQNLIRLVEDNFMAGMFGELPIKSFYVREYIQMDSIFTAFYGDMPVNPEIRLFIRDGKLEGCFWYWIEEAIAQSKKPSIVNWMEVMESKKKEIEPELSKVSLDGIAKKIGSVIPGYWSVDLCRAINGEWYLIDMALGELSWHPDR